MDNFKSKVKNFWEDHKVDIIAVGTGVAGCLVVGYMVRKSYIAGFVDGGMFGVELGFDWLDKTYPGESRARELYERYMLEHPDEVVHRTGFGKWSK